MTRKLSTNQKKFNRMVSGLLATWDCDLKKGCVGCPFNVKDEDVSMFIHEHTTERHCGAMALRQLAKNILLPDAKKKNARKLKELW